MIEDIKKSDKVKIIAFIFIFIAIFGNIAIADIHILGVVPTYYRVLTPILFLYIFWRSKHYNKANFFQENSMIVRLFFSLLLFWILYGVITLFISPWSSFSDGAREILTLILAVMNVYIIVYFMKEDCTDVIILAIKISIAILLIIGIFEVFTGKHLGVSRWNDPDFIKQMEGFYEDGEIPKEVRYVATGIFYNPNDYCAFLSIFSPVFLLSKNRELKRIVGNYIMLFLVFLVLLVDDAWICVVSLLLGLGAYLVMTKAHLIKWIMVATIFITARFSGGALIAVISECLYKLSHNDIFNHKVMVSEVETAVLTQLDNMSQNQGSLFLRINTYLESIREMFLQSKGLGLGAGSFGNYFDSIAEKKGMMSNPHSLWVEILVQYGAIVFLIFIVALVIIFSRLVVKALKEKNETYMLVIAMGVSFIFASFAPSSYLTNSYYWIPIGMALGIIDSNPRFQKKV